MIQRESAPLAVKRKVPAASKTMGTFAPAYLKSANEREVDPVAEATFGEKKWVWVKDVKAGFLKAWITQEDGEMLHVRCSDDTDRLVGKSETDRVNPPKFDCVQDMASLTYLNEPSVAHNLQQRHGEGSIYTYSGLFLVAVNPYRPLPIYNAENIEYFRHRKRDEIAKPHVFGTSDLAFRNMLEMRQNQSILVTGESGAGKTENTKKVIQYLAAIASRHLTNGGSRDTRGNLEQQIIQANPILEAFGNAQTVRNDNSSRFGKFIRILFSEQGEITGAKIDWFLLEKSRVVKQSLKERNYHVFYQLLAGASQELRSELLLDGSYKDYAYLRDSRGPLPGVSDRDMFAELVQSFEVMQFTKDEQHHFFRVIAAILLIGNIEIAADRADQARLANPMQVEKVCHLLGISPKDFTTALLTPRVRAGREWVTSARSASQVKSSLAALARTLYERNFGALVDRINETTERRDSGTSSFIGVLDMAGFEIFEKNSFEQLCINYTNEKLQQFFNHHMFVLEQEEYAREQIEWKFIDFGLDLQPTIELIEKSKPIGILSCLDEESVMPKATDVTFTEKLHHLWKNHSEKYRTARFPKDGFVLRHYAADVEYSTEGWLEKNKDPLNENVTQLLAHSTVNHVAHLFSDSDTADGPQVKKGMFRTVAQRHKEQLSALMTQLHSTQPHFIRCIIPNHQKSSKQFDFALVLDQLRCNGVLEGIRIARTGFPNRLEFMEFKQRYSVLATDMPKGYLDGHKAARFILESIDMDPAYFRIGLTKVFFRAGVLAELEEKRDALLRDLIIRVQAISIGYLKRRLVHKRLHRKEATILLKHDFKKCLELSRSPWWQLFVKMKPVLSATRSDRETKMRSAEILKLEALAKEKEDAAKMALDKMNLAESAKTELEVALRAERTTAADKEELYHRSCERERLLQEDLDMAVADVDTLENRCDELLSMKKDLESQITSLRLNVDQGTVIAQRLQNEKTALVRRIEEIELTMTDSTQRELDLVAAQKTNEDKLEGLRAQLSTSEAELSKLRERHSSAQAELSEMSKSSNSRVENIQKQLDNALLEKKAARNQLDELVTSTSTNASLIRKKDDELADLKQQLSKHVADESRLEIANSDAKIQLDSLKSTIGKLEHELADLKAGKAELEKELVMLREGLATSAAQKDLESKITDLRQQLEDQKAEASGISKESRLAIDAKHREAETHRLNVQRLEVINGDLVKQIAKAMQESMQLKQELRDVTSTRTELTTQRDALKLRLSKAESESESVDTVRLGLQKELQDALNRAKAATAKASQVDVEKERFRREAMDMKAKFDELLLQRKNGEGSNERYKSDLAAAQHKLRVLAADHDAVKIELYKSKAKLDHMNRLDEDLVATQVRDVTKQKDVLENQLKSAQADNSRIEQELLNLKTNKTRFTKEMQDLNHELDREHQIAKAAEHKTSQLQRSLADLRTNLDLEKQQTVASKALLGKIQANLDSVTADLATRTAQVVSLYRAISGDETAIASTIDMDKVNASRSVDLAKQLYDARTALKKAEASKAMLEAQLSENKQRHRELTDFDSKHAMYKLRSDSISTLDVRTPPRPMTAPWTPPQPSRATFESPGRSRTNTLAQNFEARGALPPEPPKFDNSNNKIKALQAEVEQLQNQLSQAQGLRQSAVKSDVTNESDTTAVLSRLTKENQRLHELLDNNVNQVDALETAQRRDRQSLREMQNKSMAEVESTLKALTDDKIALTRAQHKSIADLEAARADLETVRQSKESLQQNLKELQARLDKQVGIHSNDSALVVQLEDEVTDAQLKAEAEALRAQELNESVKMYRQRAEEYFDRLEQAESTVIRATHFESTAKRQLQESEDALQAALRDRQSQDTFIGQLQKQLLESETKLEDGQLELAGMNTQKLRLQQELEQYRTMKSQELEERDLSTEQTRKAYQRELVSLSSELEIEREQAVKLREDNRSIRAHIEELRSKYTEEQFNAATWEKEATRKETKLQDLIKDLQSSETAQRESQNRTVVMLSEIRELRVAKEELTLEKEEIAKQKAALEIKIRSLSASLNEKQATALQRMPSSSRKDLAARLAEKEDLLQAMTEKVALADMTVATSQKEISGEREANVQLHKAKAALESEKKELQLRVVDLETKSNTTSSNDVKFLRSRIAELEKELNGQDRAKIEESRTVRNADRAIKDLEALVAQKEVLGKRLEDKIAKAETRTQSLQADLETSRDSESASQLRARRAEREANDQRERALRAEKELERYRSRDELTKISRSNTMNRLNGALTSLKSESPMSIRSTYAPVR